MIAGRYLAGEDASKFSLLRTESGDQHSPAEKHRLARLGRIPREVGENVERWHRLRLSLLVSLRL